MSIVTEAELHELKSDLTALEEESKNKYQIVILIENWIKVKNNSNFQPTFDAMSAMCLELFLPPAAKTLVCSAEQKFDKTKPWPAIDLNDLRIAQPSPQPPVRDSLTNLKLWIRNSSLFSIFTHLRQKVGEFRAL